jgi:SAM-dependent methyltransferase
MVSPEYKPQVSADCYERTAFQPLRIESITEQFRLLSHNNCRDVLEIGAGKGLMKQFLKAIPTVKHTSVDIAEDLNADVIGSVLELPFPDNRFDSVVCCQVLEHLRFQDFARALAEIYRVTSDVAILSLPDTRRRFGFGLCLGRLDWRKYEFNFHRSVKREELAKDHYWEIGHDRTTRYAKVVAAIRSVGFRIEKQYRLEKFSWHCFFILRKG